MAKSYDRTPKSPDSQPSTDREAGDSTAQKEVDCWLLRSDFYHGYLPRQDVGVMLRHHGDFLVRLSEVSIMLQRGVRLCRWEFFHRNIKVLKVIGRGAYGEVKLAELRRRNGEVLTVAAKTVSNEGIDSTKKIKDVLKEARIMRGGALDVYLRKNFRKVTNDERLRFANGVAWGMEYLHSNNILHRDLATRNCLYDGNLYVKIADFGLSRRGTTYKMKVIQKMPIRYMAPESLSDFLFSQKTDVYTFGVSSRSLGADRFGWMISRGGGSVALCGKKSRIQNAAIKPLGKMSEEAKQERRTPGLANLKAKATEKKRSSVRAHSAKPHDRKSRRSKRSVSATIFYASL
ncbi:unnamed protein product [Heligmosomoides polygyrus]|uniref:Non-specific protein-tyrosine kinase n=1 Tax=Heligmosomoides polygyrus TaxID=6339 RepID=A0A3P7ZV47_HELPZ|nr:unnamed protein product [Heligmosomoides polygyrus]